MMPTIASYHNRTNCYNKQRPSYNNNSSNNTSTSNCNRLQRRPLQPPPRQAWAWVVAPPEALAISSISYSISTRISTRSSSSSRT